MLASITEPHHCRCTMLQTRSATSQHSMALRAPQAVRAPAAAGPLKAAAPMVFTPPSASFSGAGSLERRERRVAVHSTLRQGLGQVTALPGPLQKRPPVQPSRRQPPPNRCVTHPVTIRALAAASEMAPPPSRTLSTSARDFTAHFGCTRSPFRKPRSKTTLQSGLRSVASGVQLPQPEPTRAWHASCLNHYQQAPSRRDWPMHAQPRHVAVHGTVTSVNADTGEARH